MIFINKKNIKKLSIFTPAQNKNIATFPQIQKIYLYNIYQFSKIYLKLVFVWDNYNCVINIHKY